MSVFTDTIKATVPAVGAWLQYDLGKQNNAEANRLNQFNADYNNANARLQVALANINNNIEKAKLADAIYAKKYEYGVNDELQNAMNSAFAKKLAGDDGIQGLSYNGYIYDANNIANNFYKNPTDGKLYSDESFKNPITKKDVTDKIDKGYYTGKKYGYDKQNTASEYEKYMEQFNINSTPTALSWTDIAY